MHYGAAKHREAFSYLQVGVRIGLGIVVGGKLLRGSNGAAGEIGRLPFPWSPTETPSREGLEHYLGSAALIERCARDWPETEGPRAHLGEGALRPGRGRLDPGAGLGQSPRAGYRPPRRRLRRHARSRG